MLQDVDEGVPGRRASRRRRSSDSLRVALPLPGGPVQGPARAAHPVPRRQPGRVLLDGVVLGRPVRPDGAGRGGHARARATAVLPARRAARGQRRGATFQLTSALVCRARQFLSAYVSASSDPATYGKITVLQLPAETQTLGPQQVQSQFLSSPHGQLATEPACGGTRRRSSTATCSPSRWRAACSTSSRCTSNAPARAPSYPVLARVLVATTAGSGYDADLGKALEQVFGAGAGSARRAGQAPAATQHAAPGAAVPAPNPANPDQAAAAAAIADGHRPAEGGAAERRLRRPGPGPGRAGRRGAALPVGQRPPPRRPGGAAPGPGG